MEDYRFQGEIGQKLGEALLLRFLGPARPEPDLGIDAVAVLRSNYCSDDCMASVFFNFQFKTGELKADSHTVMRWIILSDRQPVFLIEIKSDKVEQQRYRFLALHEWMIQNPHMPDRITNQKTVSFPSSNFQQVEPSGENFLIALKDEANRVMKKRFSLWRTSPSPYLPFTEPDLFHHFGRLSALETSAALVAGIRDTETADNDVWERLRDMSKSPVEFGNSTQSPEVRNWLNGIVRIPSREQHSREIGEFRKFRRAMLNVARGKPFDLPGFTYDEISCWRIFVQLFPESLRLLERLAKHPKSFPKHQSMAAFGLLSTLASSCDASLSGRATKLIDELSSGFLAHHADDFLSYTVLRQLYFNSAETNGSWPAIKRCIDFIHRHPLEWDLELNRHYYGEHSDAAFVRSNLSKLEYPKERDLRTKRISEFFLERMPVKLIDAARTPRQQGVTSK